MKKNIFYFIIPLICVLMIKFINTSTQSEEITISNSSDLEIHEMIHTDKTVIADIWVSKEENCFQMIQSGSAHNEMVLSKDQKQDKLSAEKGKILV